MQPTLIFEFGTKLYLQPPTIVRDAKHFHFHLDTHIYIDKISLYSTFLWIFLLLRLFRRFFLCIISEIGIFPYWYKGLEESTILCQVWQREEAVFPECYCVYKSPHYVSNCKQWLDKTIKHMMHLLQNSLHAEKRLT